MWKSEVQMGELNSCLVVHRFTEETDTVRQDVLLTAVYNAAPQGPGADVDPRRMKSHDIWSQIKPIEASTLTVITETGSSHRYIHLCLCFDTPIF